MNEQLGPGLELIGRHRHPYTRCMQVPEQFLHPGVGTGMYVDMGGVIGFEIGQGGVDERLIRSLRQGLLHQVSHPVPHHPAILLHPVQRVAAQAQGMVHRLRQICQRVNQCSVQVKEDQIILHIHG